MLGTPFKKKNGGGDFLVTATDGAGWILQRQDAFEAPVAVSVDELRRDFVKATSAIAPAPVDEDAGWQRLSAEAKLAAMAQAVDLGEIQEGDRLDSPGMDGERIEGQPLTEAGERGLRRVAARPSGRKAPTPEDVFAEAQREATDEAAAKIIGSSELLASYEIGDLDAAPEVRKVVDRHIRQRNALEDRQTYGTAHVFDRQAGR